MNASRQAHGGGATAGRSGYNRGRATPGRVVRDPFADEGDPDLQTVLDALDCRDIVRALEKPKTADEREADRRRLI